ncbi:bifunctional transcriptional activator/DNA repair enzyme AdaA [Paenibacillus thiaminolyticus]|uniref:bifunctional transcriptional activator/DNA repair enzyme AdaA n=1 Tax=Paenibacillus thiaminolyticus TaxID=49283 RepID=UPI0023302F14|nr:bifunctional transcriptional activator/DNA repair enzyme AdaA [Paenibacillus thiaminolyticus]WCF10828.1 bifunctional transcriptional activator/DNA repair enzyme AdaA [Paenibacillus thiaminolyticus]
MPEPVTDEMWQAIVSNNSAYDGQFWYAVKSTGIFCRPSCKSRPPKRENVGFFRSAEAALSAHYRPCKRCKPTGERLPDDEWIAIVTSYIDRNYAEKLTLHRLAEISHGSPYHLHRIFKKIMGVTPVEYVQRRRIGQAKELLRSTKLAIAEVGQSVGLANPPYFITLFKQTAGCTPAEYRKRQQEAAKEDIDYGKES